VRIIGLGQAVLLYNWTRADLNDTRFSTAAGDQLGYLLNNAPRAPSGAISHRVSDVELWCVLAYRSDLPFSDLTLTSNSRVRIQGRLRIYGTSLHRIFWCPPE
jgi:hypothetical protein